MKTLNILTHGSSCRHYLEAGDAVDENDDDMTSEQTDDVKEQEKLENKRARMLNAFDVMGYSLEAGRGKR